MCFEIKFLQRISLRVLKVWRASCLLYKLHVLSYLYCTIAHSTFVGSIIEV